MTFRLSLRALNVELTDEAVEATSPLSLPKGSFEAAVMSLPSGAGAPLNGPVTLNLDA